MIPNLTFDFHWPLKPWAIIESEIWNHVIVDARGSATRLDARSARIWSKDNSHDKDQGLDEIWDFSRTNTWEVLVPIFWFAFWIFQFQFVLKKWHQVIMLLKSTLAAATRSRGAWCKGEDWGRATQRNITKIKRKPWAAPRIDVCIYTHTELWRHVVEEFEDPWTYGAMLDAPPIAILRMEDITTVDTLTVSVPANIVYLEKSWLWHFIESRFMIWHLNGNLTGGQGSKDPH